jgi:XTP/dITP diphosphohydrolase
MRRFTGTELLVATHNHGKLEEIAHLLEPFGISVSSAKDHGLPEPEETGHDFRRERPDQGPCRGQATGLPALSDDSGIEIDALDGRPGVYTADWAETPTGRDFVMAMTRAHDALEAAGAPEPSHRAVLLHAGAGMARWA